MGGEGRNPLSPSGERVRVRGIRVDKGVVPGFQSQPISKRRTQVKADMYTHIEDQINDWLEIQSPEFREAVNIARRNSTNGDFLATETGYAHNCSEPERLGKAKCCLEAGAEIQINPASWQQIQVTAKAMGKSVEEVWGQPDNWYEDEDIKASKKWKKPI